MTDALAVFQENYKINANMEQHIWPDAAAHALLAGHSDADITLVFSALGANDTAIQHAIQFAHTLMVKRAAWDVIEYKTGDMSMQEAIGEVLGVAIERIIKRRHGRACTYTLVINGEHSHIMTGAQILGYRAVQEAIFDTAGHVIPGLNQARWTMILEQLPIVEEDE